MHEVSFNKIAEKYDKSREVPIEVIDQLLECLKNTGILQVNKTLVDVACGTGRYLIPFASFFVQSIGLDISREMIDIAKHKNKSEHNIDFIITDARAMNIPDNAADVVISSKLFLHVRGWKKIVSEINRISRSGGYFIYINESGLFNNNVRKKFRELCNQSELDYGFLGEVDLDKVALAIEEAGFHRVNSKCNGLAWSHCVRYADAYEALKRRSFAEFQQINDDDYQTILDLLANWVQEQSNGWDESQEMQAKLRVDIFQKN